MTTFEQLKEIINAGANHLTNDAKAFVYTTADALGITYKQTTCKSCVIDLAVECANALKDDSEVSVTEGLHLKDGVDIIVNGTRICAATCSTIEECEWAMSIGTPKHYFEGVE